MLKPAPKETPPAETPAGTFDPIAVGDKIAVLLSEAGKARVVSETAQFAARKADAAARQHTRAAAKLLLDVKTNHAEHLEPICKRIGLGRSRQFELLAIVEGRKTEEETKADTNKRVKEHRAKKKAAAKAAKGKPDKKEDASPSIQPAQESVTSRPVTDSGEGKDLRGHNNPPDEDVQGPADQHESDPFKAFDKARPEVLALFRKMWRNDSVRAGTVAREFVAEVTQLVDAGETPSSGRRLFH